MRDGYGNRVGASAVGMAATMRPRSARDVLISSLRDALNKTEARKIVLERNGPWSVLYGFFAGSIRDAELAQIKNHQAALRAALERLEPNDHPS